MSYYKNILLIDDDAEDQLFFKDSLREVAPEASCMIAADGQQALRMLAIQPRPDIIFLDLHLPVMSGLEFLKEFMAEENYKIIPVIVLTSPLQYLKECDELGVIACLKKPLTDIEWQATLQRVLSRDVVKYKKQLRT